MDKGHRTELLVFILLVILHQLLWLPELMILVVRIHLEDGMENMKTLLKSSGIQVKAWIYFILSNCNGKVVPMLNQIPHDEDISCA